MPDEPSDASLIACAAAGDRQAFDMVAGRYGLRLRRAAMRVLDDAAAAEDAAQDTLLRAWTKAASYRPQQASVGTWLQRIRRHVHTALAPLPPMMRAIGMGALAAGAAAGLYAGLAPVEAEFGHALAPTIQATNPATVLAALVP